MYAFLVDVYKNHLNEVALLSTYKLYFGSQHLDHPTLYAAKCIVLI